MKEFTRLRFSIEDGVARIVLARPERLNALDDVALEELARAAALASSEPSARAILVTGEGRGFCAGADVKFMMEYRVAKHPLFSASWSYVDSVETPDNYTLVVKLKAPFKSFLNDMESTVIPEHIFAGIDDPMKYANKLASLSGGPYTFVSYDKQAGVLTYKVNDKYWGKKPNVDVIEIRTYKTKDVMMLALQNGEIDLPYIYGGNIDYFYLANILANKNLKVDIYDPPAVSKVIWFNNNRYPYNITEMRTAISYAIDYNEIVRLITGGFGDVADAGFIPSSAPYHIETRKMIFDKDKSIAMLDALGFKDINGDGFREMPDGKKFQPTILMGAEDPSSDNYRIGQLLKKYFNNVGIDIKFAYQDGPTFWDLVETKEDFDMCLAGAGTWLLTDYAGYWTGAFDDRSWGWAVLTDPEYTAMVDKLVMTNDQEGTAKILADMQQYYAKNLPALPLYTSKKIQPYSDKFEGWKYHYIWGIFNLETMNSINKTK